jgi:hypothetical protein
MRVFLGLGRSPTPGREERRAAVRRYCVTCHGEQGRGAQAPACSDRFSSFDQKGEIAPVLKEGR